MIKEKTKEILDILNLSDDYAEKRKERRKGSDATNEFFTPNMLVCHMCDKVPAEKWADPESTWLEPSFGNGQFLVEIVRRRIQDYDISWKTTLDNLYGIELMPDNREEAVERIIDLLKALDVPNFDESVAREIMAKNLVCSDFFKWDCLNWCPIEEVKEPVSIELF